LRAAANLVSKHAAHLDSGTRNPSHIASKRRSAGPASASHRVAVRDRHSSSTLLSPLRDGLANVRSAIEQLAAYDPDVISLQYLGRSVEPKPDGGEQSGFAAPNAQPMLDLNMPSGLMAIADEASTNRKLSARCRSTTATSARLFSLRAQPA